MVAAGHLDKVWLAGPEYETEEELQDAFRRSFGLQWAEVLDVSDRSFAYNTANHAYFAVRGLRAVEGLTLEQLLQENGIGTPLNIIAS